MKYIPLDEVEKVLIEWDMDDPCVEQIKKQFKTIKTIDLSIIDEMIEEATAENWTLTPFPIWLIVWTLRKLKERLSLNK